MKIAIDVSPLQDVNLLAHRVRGTGFYIENLKKSLLQYFPENEYIFFTRGNILPKDIDIIHYPYFEPFFLTLPFRKRRKTVVTVHDLTPLVFPKYFQRGVRGSFKWWVQKKVLQRVAAIITDSQSSKNDIIRYADIPETKIRVVYLAAGEEFRRIQNSESRIQNLRRKYNLPEKFALYVGDVTWNKNLPRLIEAIRKTEIPLVMVGKSLLDKQFDRRNLWNQDLLSVQKSVENDPRFILLGFVPTEDLVVLYNIATVFVMPSIYEGFGLPILEALSCGCPVVTSRGGSLSEISGNAVLYVDPYDSGSIARGITDVIADESLQKKLSQKGYKQAGLFSWRKTASQTIEVYEKTFSKR